MILMYIKKCFIARMQTKIKKCQDKELNLDLASISKFLDLREMLILPLDDLDFH